MKTFSAAEAKNRFGVLLESAQREPVRIEKNGRPVAVVISHAHYENLVALYAEADNAYSIQLAKEGEASGYLSAEESERFFRRLLKFKD